jgi:hypothetical protein
VAGGLAGQTERALLNLGLAPGTSAVTLIGVSSLWTPEMLIEIEAVAVFG